MTDGSFEVDTDILGRPVSDLHEHAQNLHNLFIQHEANLDEVGMPWGFDPAGTQFESTYVPARNQLMTGGISIGGVLHGVASGLLSMSKGFHQSEQSAVDSAGQLFQSDPSGPPVGAPVGRPPAATDPQDSQPGDPGIPVQAPTAALSAAEQAPLSAATPGTPEVPAAP